jgi:hypothetical protein
MPRGDETMGSRGGADAAASAPILMLEGKADAQRSVTAKENAQSISENRPNDDTETSLLSMFLTSIVMSSASSEGQTPVELTSKSTPPAAQALTCHLLVTAAEISVSLFDLYLRRSRRTLYNISKLGTHRDINRESGRPSYHVETGRHQGLDAV